MRSQESKSILAKINDRGPGGATRQAASLRTEGVVVVVGSLGELTVSYQFY